MELKLRVKVRNSGLTPEQRAILRIERLYLVQVYKGLMLVECRSCKDVMTFPVEEEDITWSCASCDRKRLPALYLLTERTRRNRHERPYARRHRMLAGAA